MAGKIRKRMMVTEGDLMQLWFEVEQVRNEEKKQQFKASFKALMQEAQLIKMQVLKKATKSLTNTEEVKHD